MNRLACVVIVTTILPIDTARAQEPGRLGVTMVYPGTIGVLWHATTRLAIRPEIGFRRNSNEGAVVVGITDVFNGAPFTGSTTTTVNSSWFVSPGVSLLVFVARWDEVSAYVTPGYSYTRNSHTSVTTTQGGLTTIPVLPSASRIETEHSASHWHEFRGAFGVQYVPHRRFGVFGEAGVSHTENSLSALLQIDASTTTSMGSLGVTFYF
jgi:hypothetical protein